MKWKFFDVVVRREDAKLMTQLRDVGDMVQLEPGKHMVRLKAAKNEEFIICAIQPDLPTDSAFIKLREYLETESAGCTFTILETKELEFLAGVALVIFITSSGCNREICSIRM